MLRYYTFDATKVKIGGANQGIYYFIIYTYNKWIFHLYNSISFIRHGSSKY